MPAPPSGTGPGFERVLPASVSHFIIFNPTLQISKPKKEGVAVSDSEATKNGQDGGERDKDLEDDMKEAAQILFYTSREGGKVSRDKMLRQFGLAKGLMGFTDMVLAEPGIEKEKEVKGWWGVHSHKSRMIIWSPEPKYYIYINVTLSHKLGGETIHGSQGISDNMIVDALQRGYEDFCLLHDSLASLHPSTGSTSSLLERFWTRFAFQFEAAHLSPSDEDDILQSWIGGYPARPASHSPTSRAINEVLASSSSISSTGILARKGPIHLSSTIPPTLVRFLVNALPAPPPVFRTDTPVVADRSSLGLGFGLGLRRKPAATGKADEERQSSWTSWVPGIGTSGSSTPSTKVKASEDKKHHESRWPSFGLGSLGMGTAFGMGKEAEPIHGGPNASEGSNRPHEGAQQPITANSTTSKAKRSLDSQHHVEQSKVDMPDLEAAVDADAAVELAWEKKDVWLESGDESGKREKRRVSWIIRNDLLLYVLFAADTTESYPLPSTSATLAVFGSLATASVPLRGSTDSVRPSTPQIGYENASIHAQRDGTTDIQDLKSLDSSSAATLSELKDLLASDHSLQEVHAKSSNGKFLVAKRLSAGEVYLQLGRKDASLTDSEQALRSFRPHSLVS